ncbi:MAG: dTDP-4-dehydrorhamnose reductase [Proteobacteria bacterium]|nr:dTDP-4-dehydrorhamnose reductase [Pseudomonadota bacterium]
MRLVVTGRAGQVTRALQAAAGHGVVVIPAGRPEIDLLHPDGVDVALAALSPDVVVNAAAFTAVDLAETEREAAFAINGAGAGAVARAAARLAVPVIHLSTDYVFDGTNPVPYVETDAVAPANVYGQSKLAGERAVAAATDNHAILRTSWVYAAAGKNFVATMLRLAETRDEVGVVSDQQGAPTYAPDIADAVIAVARNLVADPHEPRLRGIFHMTGAGATTWAGFAEAIFARAGARRLPRARVRPILTADYPTPARRPANSRLDCGRLTSTHGVTLPDWRDALDRCMDAIAAQRAADEDKKT